MSLVNCNKPFTELKGSKIKKQSQINIKNYKIVKSIRKMTLT